MDFTEKNYSAFDGKYSGRIFTVTQDIVELPNGKTYEEDLIFHRSSACHS